MPTYLALLRGINVSGKKIIKMEELRMLFEANGYSNAKTYIQSGNIIFTTDTGTKKQVAAALEALIKKSYGYDVTVFVLDIGDLEKAIDNNPFVGNRQPEGAGSKKLYVTFLLNVASAENIEKLRQAPIGHDLIELTDNVLYFKLQTKASESKLSNNLIETKLKVKATTRNWNTTLKLMEILQAGI